MTANPNKTAIVVYDARAHLQQPHTGDVCKARADAGADIAN